VYFFLYIYEPTWVAGPTYHNFMILGNSILSDNYSNTRCTETIITSGRVTVLYNAMTNSLIERCQLFTRTCCLWFYPAYLTYISAIRHNATSQKTVVMIFAARATQLLYRNFSTHKYPTCKCHCSLSRTKSPCFTPRVYRERFVWDCMNQQISPRVGKLWNISKSLQRDETSSDCFKGL
jgi:hypothetical protein